MSSQVSLPVRKHKTRPRAADIIPLEKLISLRRKKLKYSDIARLYGRTPAGIRHRLVDNGFVSKIDHAKEIREVRADMLTAKTSQMLEAMTEKKLNKASIRDLAFGYGILLDKERLLTGKSTQNVSYAVLLQTAEEKKNELNALEAGEEAYDIEAEEAEAAEA